MSERNLETPIADALRLMGLLVGDLIQPHSRFYVGPVAAARLEDTGRHANAVVDAVAKLERRLYDRTVRLQRLEPHESLLVIAREIHAERVAQDEQHGGPAADDTLTMPDWFDRIMRQMEIAGRAVGNPPVWNNTDLAACRFRLVKIAALCIAACQSIDRQNAATPAPEAGA